MNKNVFQKVILITLLAISVSSIYGRNKYEPQSSSSEQFVQFSPSASYVLCFVPDGPKCENLIVGAINETKKSLLIQAYSFTNVAIADAVVKAHDRGVDVRVIVDKSQVSEKYTSAKFLQNSGIPVFIDTKPAIAHNKVMIFDGESIFTGSFNFTKAAQNRNTENGILIKGDGAIVKAYSNNWLTRLKQSAPY